MLYKVYTRDRVMFPRRRRAGHEFTPEARTIELDGDAERAILADDALVAVPMSIAPDDTAIAADLAAAHEQIAELRGKLERADLLRSAAFARLAEHGIELNDLQGAHAGLSTAATDFGAGDPESPPPRRHKAR